MSEIQEAIQIIKVSIDGVDIVLKVGNSGIKGIQHFLKYIHDLLQYEKQLGQTSMKKMLAKGGDLQVLQFEAKNLKQVQQYAKKYGILYTIPFKTKNEEGMMEIIFHVEATPRINAMIEKLKSGTISNFEDYVNEIENKKDIEEKKERTEKNTPRLTTDEELKNISKRIEILSSPQSDEVVVSENQNRKDKINRIGEEYIIAYGENQYEWISPEKLVEPNNKEIGFVFLDRDGNPVHSKKEKHEKIKNIDQCVEEPNKKEKQVSDNQNNHHKSIQTQTNKKKRKGR